MFYYDKFKDFVLDEYIYYIDMHNEGIDLKCEEYQVFIAWFEEHYPEFKGELKCA